MRYYLATAILLLAAACSLRSNAPASQTYILRAHAPEKPAAARPATASLQVSLPIPAPGLYSERIVLVQPDHRMSHFAASQWAAELPHLVEALAIERLRATGDWTAVTDSESAFASDYFLQISIRRFEAEYTSTAAPPTAQVAFDCAIGRRADRTLLASFTAQGAATASANRVGAVVAAFDEAANTALNELATDSAAAVKNSQSPSSP
ncbi:MAG TPA: ABC-type transport auxiliary lipoprotein family protein [Steroidobacteraceae bacterium]|jgi:cholesterol transport system auxiliary component